MKSHVQVIGWLYIILGVLGILLAAFVCITIVGGGLISGDRTAIAITSMVAAIVGGLITLLSIPGIVVGAGLLKFKPWARILAIVLGLLNLVNFPVGTALGIYAIWALLDEETIGLFEPLTQEAI